MRDLSAAWAIVKKDLAVWTHQPSAIAATLLPALAMLVVVVIAAQAVGRNQVALVQLDNGPRAQRLAAILNANDAFVVHPESAADARQALQTLQVAAIITIPASFDAAYAAGQPDPVTIEINNLNLDFTNDLRRSLPEAITEFYATQSGNPIEVRVAESDLRASDVDLAQFELIPTLVLLITIAGVVNSGLAVAREWEQQTAKELLLAPISRASLIGGKLLAGWLTTLLVAGVVVGLGAATGLLRPHGVYWLVTMLFVALLALASSGLGVALGAAFRRFQRVTAVSIPLSFYLFFLSGGISVVAFLPAWAQTLARFVPTYYGVHGLQMAVFYGSTEQLGLDLGVTIATAVLTTALGIATLRRQVGS